MKHDTIAPILSRIPASRQEAKRHYGVHPYFTRRPFNVVRDYILHYTDEGDVVVDPFGGSGVTAIEAYLENRVGIQSDINPLANFIATGLIKLTEATDAEIACATELIETRCRQKLTEGLSESSPLDKVPGILLPPNHLLPRTADVRNYYELFTPGQLLSLAILKTEIDKLDTEPVRQLFLLAWSGALARLNKTFISTNGRAESRGGSSIFSIYRYKVAKRPVELDPWEVFTTRLTGVLTARKEIKTAIEAKKTSASGWRGQYRCYQQDVLQLADELKGTADYIFTDPPYGGHIAYLDLSTLWNVWLGIMPENGDRDKELIVGGEKGFTEEYYTRRLYESVEALFKMLKDRRWISIVFQHWNVLYFKAILEAADHSHGLLSAAVSQIGDPIWSMHKKKGKASVLAGELILTFFKDTNSQSPRDARISKPLNIDELIDSVLRNQNGTPVFGEHLFNMLVVKAWEHGAIDDLKINKLDFANIMKDRGWSYNPTAHTWQYQTSVQEPTMWD